MKRQSKKNRFQNWCQNTEKWMRQKWQEHKVLMKPFLILVAIYLLGLSALILAGVHFADDVARTNHGYAGWSGFSRYISTVLSHGIHADNYLTNVAPWPQLLAVVILAATSVLMIIAVCGRKVFDERWTKWIWPVIAVVPLGLSPYMLECLSYQYDAVYMAISVMAAVVPVLFWRRSWLSYGMVIAIGVLVICMTYQAAIGILPMLIIMVAARAWNKGEIKNKEIIKRVVFAALIFVIVMVIFQKFLMRPREAYVSNDLPAIGEFFPVLFDHLRIYFELVVSDFRLLWKILIGIIGVLFVALFVVRSQKNRVAAFVMGIVTLGLMGLMTLVIYAALESPLYAPRAMYAVGAFIAIIGVYVAYGKYAGFVTKIPLLVLTYCFVMFALTYGNALKEQNNYRNERAQMVISDLNQLEVMRTDGYKIVQVDGWIGLSPVIEHMPLNDYRILYRLMMPSYSEYVPWMEYAISQQLIMPNIYYNPEVDLNERELPLLKETLLYDIYGDEAGILVKFKYQTRYDLIF